MKTHRIILLMLFSCFLLSMTCRKRATENCHYEIRMQNDSDIPIYVFLSYDYPDTGLNFQRPGIDRLSNRASAHNWCDIRDETDCIESKINYNGAEKLTVFIFDGKLIDTTPWQQVRQNYQVLKRYNYTVEELKALDFKLVYPR
jgi:hypothetical protein